MAEYSDKPFGYYQHLRWEIIDEVPGNSGSILEVGCAEGQGGAYLKMEKGASWVAGVELMAEPAEKAGKVLDQVLVGNVEDMDLPFIHEQFDVIICADVLEHLIDPWSMLSRLRFYLKRNGIIIVSLPNVRNWRVLVPLVFEGKWEYKEEGIMDRTHLRFFTRLEGMKLFKNCGFEIEKISPTGRKSKSFLDLGMNFLSELTAVQYVFVGRRI